MWVNKWVRGVEEEELVFRRCPPWQQPPVPSGSPHSFIIPTQQQRRLTNLMAASQMNTNCNLNFELCEFYNFVINSKTFCIIPYFLRRLWPRVFRNLIKLHWPRQICPTAHAVTALWAGVAVQVPNPFLLFFTLLHLGQKFFNAFSRRWRNT